jgi:hypothetical protein
MCCAEVMKIAFISIELLSASFGTTSLKMLCGLVMSKHSAARSIQKRNRCASMGSERGHATRVYDGIVVDEGMDEGMEERQSDGRGESILERLQRLETESGAGLM